MAPSSHPLHALVLPHPLQGHITPHLHLSRKLASSYGLSITFIVPEDAFNRMASSNSHSDPSINIIGLPDGLPADHPRRSTFLDSYEAVVSMEMAVGKFMQELAHQGRLPDFILADTFVFWAHALARKFGLPSVAFATTNASALAVMASMPKLLSLGVLPVKHENGSSELITCFPGIPPLHPNDLPVSLRSPTVTHYRFQYIRRQFEEAEKAVAVLVNSVYEMDKSVLDGLEFKVPVYTIGPTLILNGEDVEVETSMWPEEDSCLLWLDKQAARSVLYVSFGSMAFLDAIQLGELAMGLEATTQPFLWVIRLEGTSISDVLPPGFLDRIKGRGTIISWAPQLRVLSHPAVGGFLTHCGWNSVLENLCLGGLPMICWPDAAEQALNARIIVDVWKVGLSPMKDEDGRVKSAEVERVVKAVMQGEGGREMRCKAAEMKHTVRRSVQEGGSSLNNIQTFLDMVKQAKVSQVAP